LIAQLPASGNAPKIKQNQRNRLQQRNLQAEMLRINRILDGVKQQEVLLLESHIDKHARVPKRSPQLVACQLKCSFSTDFFDFMTL
jgi:hypothetical protein